MNNPYIPKFVKGKIMIGAVRVQGAEADRAEFMLVLADIVGNRRGVIDPEVNQVLPLYWGWLDHTESPADEALLAAYEIRDALKETNQRLAKEGRKGLRVSISLWSHANEGESSAEILAFNRVIKAASVCTENGCAAQIDFLVDVKTLKEFSVKPKTRKVGVVRTYDAPEAPLDLFRVLDREITATTWKPLNSAY